MSQILIFLFFFRSTDAELQTRPCEIFLRHTHNHELKSAAVFKFRKPSEEIVTVFHDLFNKGHSPSSAWQSYKFDLQCKYGNDYYKIAADGSVCPTRKWAYDLYYSLFKQEYGESSGDGMVQKLKDLIISYNEKCGSNCASWMAKDGNLIICICDPFMKRIHENLPASSEIMFIDSSGNMDRHSSRIFCLLCPSVAGAFPLGLIITFSEAEEVLKESFNCLRALFPEKAFYGSGYPKIIITDDSSAERNALSVCFPKSNLLLCKFHVLQAAMRYFWLSKHKILPSDRKEIFTIFHRLLNATDYISFTSQYNNALNNPLIKKYDFAVKYFLKMYSRAPEWALCYRKTLITRGNDTNNYSEANFRILKDIVLKRTKAFSVVQLFSFLTIQLIDYYKRRLTDVLNDRYEGYTKSKYYISESKLTNLSYEKIGNYVYCVKNNENSQEYHVNLEGFVCSCPVGIQGALCKHQYLVMKGENISTVNVFPKVNKEAKILFHKILTGNTDFDDYWYNSISEKVGVHEVTSSMLGTSTSVTQCLPGIEEENKDNPFTISQTNEDFRSRKESVKEALKNIFSEFDSLLDTNPEEFLPALDKFAQSYDKCKTTSAKLSALHTFGQNSGMVAPLIKKGKNVQGGKLISVQPTAVARRKVHLGGRQKQHSGRPPKSARASEHNYASEPATKKSKAAPHCISFCVENNISLGQ